jgi:hypothetical protein
MRHREAEKGKTARQKSPINYRGQVRRMSNVVLVATINSNTRMIIASVEQHDTIHLCDKARFAAVLGNEALRRGLAQ